MVAVIAIAYFSITAIRNINVDIFPKVELPVIYIAMPYGGLTPAYMDGFMANEFQKVLIFVSGVKDIDFKSVQGFTLMKLSFYPGTDMAQASGELSAQVSRAMGFLPPGAVPPQVVRFDGSSLPIGQLVFESPIRSITELQNLAQTKVRPMFVTIPGVTAPAPFGGNVRTMVVKVNPQLMQSYGLSAEQVTMAIAKNNFPAPAGNIRIGDQSLMTPLNSIANGPDDFLDIPIKSSPDNTIFIKDIATVEDGADATTGYAIINGKRSVYLPVIKKADASTLKVVENLKAAIPKLKAAMPEDVDLKYVFDQSGYIEQSLENLIHEGILGAILTGIMVFLFLGDVRGSLIVVLTIPIAILSAVIMLYLFGQTINVMTLSGLALAIGILVDEATVTIENIHQHFEMEKPKQRAILDALLEISIPKILILFCILAVLIPSFMMSGIPRDMFMPLSMAVAFAMIASFIVSQTFVPILANWLMKPELLVHQKVSFHKKKLSRFEKFKRKYLILTRYGQNRTGKVIGLYLVVVLTLIITGGMLIGTDILPASNSGDIQLRIIAPEGDRLEKSEDYLKKVTAIVKNQLPDNAIKISSAFVGLQPSATAINPIFLFTSGPHESVLQVSIDQHLYKGSIAKLKESIREAIRQKLPELKINFEPIELVEKIMSQGAMTPIQIKVAAAQLKGAEKFAKKLETELLNIPYLRDVRIAEPINAPSLQINVNRELSAQFGLTMEDVSRALTMATSSTRFTNKNLWVDPKSGLVFQVQIQIPESAMQSLEKLRSLPLKAGQARPVLEDVAELRMVKLPAQVNRQGPNRYVTLLANTYQSDLGMASKAIKEVIKAAGEPPRGVLVSTEGLMQLLDDTLSGLQTGLLVAIVVIFLMLTAYYQSFVVSGLILSVVPAVIGGSLILLTLSGSTLNLQSYMGIIMSVGVSVSNAVLMINQAEVNRLKRGMVARQAAFLAVSSRLRPIIMTSLAMIAGMIPMSLGMGEGGEQVAPLGQAVIGGLILSTLTALLVLPHLYATVMKNRNRNSPTLDPDDPENINQQKYFMKPINFKSVVLMIPLLFILASCGQEKPKNTTKKIVTAPKVQFVNPKTDQPVYSLELPGELKPYEVVTLYPKIKGFVKQILVDRGSHVKKGQLLALLEAPEVNQRYLAAKSDENKSYEDYLYSRQAYERLKKAAAKSGAVAEIELDKAKSKFRSDSAAYASVKANTGASAQLQQYLRITAPFDGVITDKNVSVGALVGENSQAALFSVAQTNHLRLTVAIPEKHTQSLGKDTKISFTVSDHPGKVFKSSISRKSNLLQQESRSATAEFDVPNNDNQFGGGEFAQVKLTMRRTYPTMWLPASSIVYAQSGVFVIKAENQMAKRIPVSIGIRKGELQEVFGEISPKDQIVKVGSEELTEGSKL